MYNFESHIDKFKLWWKSDATKVQKLIIIGAAIMIIGNLVSYVAG